MKGAHVLKSTLAALVLLCAMGGITHADEGNAEKPKDPKPDPAVLAKMGNGELISELAKAGGTGAGFSPYFTGSQFLPLDEQAEFHAGLLGGPRPENDSVLTEIVRRGPKIVAELIKALGDKRATKVILKHDMGMGGMWHDSEYERNWRTAKPLKAKEVPARDPTEFPESIKEYTLCVGDLCFVALGQIVNRRFNAVRYQPTACIVLNSTVHTAVLRQWAEEEWTSAGDPAVLKASLVSDLNTPHWEHCRIGAYKRLAYYFPDAVEEPVLKVLALPRFSEFEIFDLRATLVEQKTDDELKAAFAKAAKGNEAAVRDGLVAELLNDWRWGQGEYASDAARSKSERAETMLKTLFPDLDPKQPFYRQCPGECEFERFVRALIHDKNSKIADALHEILKSYMEPNRADPGNVALACMQRLVREPRFDKTLLKYLEAYDCEGNVNHEEFDRYREIIQNR